MNRVIRIIILGIILASLATPAAAQRSRQATPQGCDDLEAYREAVFLAIDSEEDFDAISVIMEGELDTLRRGELIEGAEAMERWAENLEDMDADDIPPVAEDMHQLTIDRVVVISNVLYAVATGGPFAAMMYVEEMDRITLEEERINRQGVEDCGEVWTDNFGTEESDEQSF